MVDVGAEAPKAGSIGRTCWSMGWEGTSAYIKNKSDIERLLKTFTGKNDSAVSLRSKVSKLRRVPFGKQFFFLLTQI